MANALSIETDRRPEDLFIVLTGNLQGPLVVNVQTRQARQLVLSDTKFSTRHPLMRLPQPQEMSRTG